MLKTKILLPPTVVGLGIFLTGLSGLYVSSFLAILGITIIFWGSLLYYIKPTKQIPVSFIEATSTPSTDNLNRFFSELQFTQKGIYLPPSKLKEPDSSLVFIPKKPIQTTPTCEEITSNMFTINAEGMLLSPPGYGLVKLMEQKLGRSFSKIEFSTLQKQLPRLLVDDLEIAENIDIQTETNIVTFEIKGSVFKGECNQTQKQPIVHDLVGCLLSSGLACALAKVTGKSVIINNEETIGKITKITCHLAEE